MHFLLRLGSTALWMLAELEEWATGSMMSSFLLFYISITKFQRVIGKQHMGFDIRPLICSVSDAFLALFGVVRPLDISGIRRMRHQLNDE